MSIDMSGIQLGLISVTFGDEMESKREIWVVIVLVSVQVPRKAPRGSFGGHHVRIVHGCISSAVGYKRGS